MLERGTDMLERGGGERMRERDAGERESARYHQY